MQNENGRLYNFVDFLVRHKLKVLIIVLAGLIIVSYGATRIQTKVILQHMFPHDHSYLKLHSKFSQIFGSGGSGVVIAVNAQQGDIFTPNILKKVKKITEEVELWDEVYRLLTVSIASNSVKVIKTLPKGEIVIDSLMFPEVPNSDRGIEELKKHIFSNPSYKGTLVSNDGSAALIRTEFQENISYERAFQLLKNIDQKYSDQSTSIHIVGYPMLMGWIYSHKSQMYLVFAISGFLMILILFIVFRNFVGMISPIAMATICTGLGLGFIGWTGINFSPLLYVLAFLVGARMLSNSVQITHRYIEEFHLTGNKHKATQRTMRAMILPNASAVATDAAGFLVLALAQIVLMQQLAIMMSFWMITIILSGVMVPIICSYLPLRHSKNYSHKSDSGWLARVNTAMAEFSIGSGKYVIFAAVILIVLVGSWKTSQLKVGDPTPGSPILWPDHTYNRDQSLINKKFEASSENFVLYYEGEKGSVYDPIVLTTFENFSYYMADELPDIYKSSSSIIDMAKMLNLKLHDGDQLWFQLPGKEEQLTGLLGYLRNTVGTAEMSRYIDRKRKRTQISLFFSDHTSDNLIRIRDAAYEFFNNNPMKIDQGEFKLAGGRIGMEIALNEEMKDSHAKMDTLVLIVIFIMCSIAFRSFIAGAMLTLPLILANLIAFSYMSWTNIGLSPNTLPCSAVGVGVGVDFAIYLYSRCIEEFPHRKNWLESVIRSVRTAGSGIVFTGTTLILSIITWYFISALKFQAQMGFFLSILLFINMIAALTLHPLLILTFKPKFIKKLSESKLIKHK